MSDLKAIEYKRFEDIKHINENGSEYWSARELAFALDYVQWRNFEKVIKRAMIACENSGHNVGRFCRGQQNRRSWRNTQIYKGL